MIDDEKIALRKALNDSLKLVEQAHAKISEAHKIAKRNEEEGGRYIAYDMEDASYHLRRLESDLGQSIDNLENEDD